MTAQARGNTKPSLRARAFLFTLNEPNIYDDFIAEIKKLKSIDYFVSARELAPTTKHVHIHLYIHLNNSYKLSRKIMSYNTHVDIAKGSPKQCIDYVKKDGDIIEEWGECPRQGNISVKELMEIKNVEEVPDWKMVNTYMKLKNMPKKVSLKDYNKEVKVIYLTGPSGSGKSTKAIELALENGFEDVDEVKAVNGFWNGVSDGCGCAIYDDFRCSDLKVNEFINFIDYRVHNLNVKGGNMKNKYSLIIITSIQSPEDIYSNCQEEREQWMRRMTIKELA